MLWCKGVILKHGFSFFLTFYLFCVWVRVHMHVCACATHMCLSVYMAPRTFYGFFFSTVCNPGGQTCLSGLATSSYTYRTVSLAWVHLMIICLFRLSVSFVFILLFFSFVPGLSRMVLNSFCITGWPQTCDYPSFSLWSAAIAEVCHHTLLDFSIYFWVSFDRCFGVVYYI